MADFTKCYTLHHLYKTAPEFCSSGNLGGTRCVHLSVSSYSDTPPGTTLFSSDSFKMNTSKFSVVLTSQGPKENDAIVSN